MTPDQDDLVPSHPRAPRERASDKGLADVVVTIGHQDTVHAGPRALRPDLRAARELVVDRLAEELGRVAEQTRAARRSRRRMRSADAIEPNLLDVQDLAVQREDRLELATAVLLG